MKKTILSLLSVTLSIAGFSQTAFTAGNLVIYRVGDGSAALTSAGTAAFMDEYTPTASASPVRSIPMPTSGNMLVASGTATSEGLLTRTVDGTAVIAGGYNAATGTASITSSNSSTINRTIGVIKYDGSVDVTTKLSDNISPSNIRSAASTDGTSFWVGNAALGVRYATLGATASTQLNSVAPTNIRQVNIFSGNVYFSTSSVTPGIYQLGSGLPTTGGLTPTVLIGTGVGASPYGFVLKMAGASPAAGDIAYIADDRLPASSGGVQKWTYNGAAWALTYILNTGTTGVRGLTVDFTNPLLPVIFATTTETSANRIITITDDLSGTSTSTLVATAGTNTVFRGVQFAPKAGILGLRFISFTGTAANSGFDLKWVTANEQSVAAFTVQKSTDGVTFEDISTTAAHNNNGGAEYHYNYTGKGIIYFRIKATELSGRAFYTGIIRTDIKSSEAFKLYPTVSNGNITLEYGAAGASGRISILNNSGSEVFRKNISAGTDRETISVQQLAPGTYFVKYITTNGTVQTIRFVKQ